MASTSTSVIKLVKELSEWHHPLECDVKKAVKVLTQQGTTLEKYSHDSVTCFFIDWEETVFKPYDESLVALGKEQVTKQVACLIDTIKRYSEANLGMQISDIIPVALTDGSRQIKYQTLNGTEAIMTKLSFHGCIWLLSCRVDHMPFFWDGADASCEPIANSLASIEDGKERPEFVKPSYCVDMNVYPVRGEHLLRAVNQRKDTGMKHGDGSTPLKPLEYPVDYHIIQNTSLARYTIVAPNAYIQQESNTEPSDAECRDGELERVVAVLPSYLAEEYDPWMRTVLKIVSVAKGINIPKTQCMELCHKFSASVPHAYNEKSVTKAINEMWKNAKPDVGYFGAIVNHAKETEAGLHEWIKVLDDRNKESMFVDDPMESSDKTIRLVIKCAKTSCVTHGHVADVLVHVAAGRFVYVGKKAWYVFNESTGLWSLDSEGLAIRKFASDKVTQVMNDTCRMFTGDDEKCLTIKKKILSIIPNLYNVSFKQALEVECREKLNDGRFTDKLNKVPSGSLPFSNGMLETSLVDGKLHKSFRPYVLADYVSMTLGYDYMDPDTPEGVTAIAALKEHYAMVLPNQERREYYIRLHSMAMLNRKPMKRFGILTDEEGRNGSNSKTLTQGMMIWSFGDFTLGFQDNLWVQSHNQGRNSHAANELANKDMWIVPQDEMAPHDKLDLGKMKEESSGTQSKRAKRGCGAADVTKYQRNYLCIALVNANQFPKDPLMVQDTAWCDRIGVIKFESKFFTRRDEYEAAVAAGEPNVYMADTSFEDKMKPYLPYNVHVLLRGYEQFLLDGECIPAICQDDLWNLIMVDDELTQTMTSFFEERCQTSVLQKEVFKEDFDNVLVMNELVADFRSYAREKGLPDRVYTVKTVPSRLHSALVKHFPDTKVYTTKKPWYPYVIVGTDADGNITKERIMKRNAILGVTLIPERQHGDVIQMRGENPYAFIDE
jgi:hypothetical protein